MPAVPWLFSSDLVASLLWLALGASLVLTVAGIIRRAWWAFALAAVLSGVFSAAALPSVGLFTSILIALQLSAALAARFPSRHLSWAGFVILGVAVWLAAVGVLVVLSALAGA